MTAHAEKSIDPLKSTEVTTSARKKLIEVLVDRDTKDLTARLKATELRLRRVLALYHAEREIRTLDPKRARAPALARYHSARRNLQDGDLKL